MKLTTTGESKRLINWEKEEVPKLTKTLDIQKKKKKKTPL